MTSAVLIGVVVVMFLIFGVILSRRQSERKKEAIEDLQREKEALAPLSIQALAEEEAADLGLAQILGADRVPPVILLKVWKRDSSVVERCRSKELLRYEVRAGVDPTLATEPDVKLVCDDESAQTPSPAAPSGDSENDQDLDEHESEEE
jgi:hypothetical protein